MDINKLVGEAQEGVLPEQVAPLVHAIIEVLKRDYMRTHIQSRVEYVEQDEDD